MTHTTASRRPAIAFLSLAAAALSLTAAPRTADAAACGTENLLAGKKPHQSGDTKGDLAQVTDGTVGPEGAQWDAPVVVTLEGTNGAITYDLGEPRSIAAIV